MPRIISDLSQLQDLISKITETVDPLSIARENDTVYSKITDPKNAKALCMSLNTSIIEIVSHLPIYPQGVKTIYTTYYLIEGSPQKFKLLRLTTAEPSATFRQEQEESKMRDEIKSKIEDYYKDQDLIFQYDQLAKEIFTKILESYSLGTVGVGLLDKALIKRCIFKRVADGTLCVGYSPVQKKYVVKYNPEFCVKATVEYLLNPVIRDNFDFSIPRVTPKTILYPVQIMLSHEFAHILYRHVSSGEGQVQNDLPQYCKQYFGDAYINNSIPYMLGADNRSPTPGSVGTLTQPTVRHPLFIENIVPITNYLKPSYEVELYKSLQDRNLTEIDISIDSYLRKYMDLLTPPIASPRIKDDLGFSSVDQFSDFLETLPVDVRKLILKSQVRFYVGNLYEVMTNIFPKGFSSNSYMRVLRAISESLFEDIKESLPTPPPTSEDGGRQSSGKGSQSDQSQSSKDQEASGGSSEESNEESDGETGRSSGGSDGESENSQGSGESSSEDSGDSGEEGSPSGSPASLPGLSDEDSQSGSQQSTPPENDEQSPDEQGPQKGTPNSSEGSGSEDLPKDKEYKFKIGDMVRQKSTGRLGKITSINDDGTCVIDTSITESLQLSELNESSVIVPMEDLEFYSEDKNSSESQDGSSTGDQGEPNPPEDQGDEADEGISDDQKSQGDKSTQGNSQGNDREDSKSPDDQGKISQNTPDNKEAPPTETSPAEPTQDSESGPPTGSDSDNQTTDGFDDLRKGLKDAEDRACPRPSSTLNDYLKKDEESSREESDREIEDEAVKDDISQTIKDSVKSATDAGEEVNKVLSGLDPEEIQRSFNVDVTKAPHQVSQARWKKLFWDKIQMSTGYDFQRYTALPSRKVEGLWGANRKVPKISNVVILLDCSGSMSSPQFKAIFAELMSMSKLPELSDTWVHMIPWGDSATYRRFKGFNRESIKQMYQYGKVCLYGTCPGTAYQMMMKKVPNPDLILMLTDCDFNDWRGEGCKVSDEGLGSNGDSVRNFISRVARKTVFVSIDAHYSHELSELDPDYKKRMVELDPTVAATGGKDFED